MRKLLIVSILFILSSSAFALTRGQIEARVRQQTSWEGNTTAHPDSTLDTLINMALASITSACSCKTELDSVITVANTKQYALNSTFENIKSVFSPRRIKKALTQIVSEDIGQMDVQIRSDSFPPYFYVEGKKSAKKIGFDYTPVKVDTIWYWFYASSKLLTHDSMTVDLPEAFDNAIVFYTTALLYYRDLEYGWGDKFMTLSELEIAKAKMKMKIPDRLVLPKGVPQ